MIHIDMDGKTPPEEWLKKAKLVSDQLDRATSDEERSLIIEKHKLLWGEIKEWLLEQSHNKCWYTEGRNDSSYFEVEHFRPKRWTVDPENPGFTGYWWLAFDFKNYRVCGNAPNRKKGTFFPLHPDSVRASSDKRNLVEDEIFCLLDPTEADDPLLLSFNDGGDATPLPGQTEWQEERARVSIDSYGLNSLPQLGEGRRRVWQKCRALLDELMELNDRYQRSPTASCRTSMKEKAKQLREQIKSDQPFSAVARTCLYVSGYPFAQNIAASA
jgi:hypothetical protein